jgi:hypothetical protein
MRKRLSIVVALAMFAALATAVTASAVLTAPDGNTQELAIKFSPKKLSKTKPTPVSLTVTATTSNPTAPKGVPVPATRAVIDFDKEAKIFTKGYPTCAASKIENTSTEEALRFCKAAKIGGGVAHALLPVGLQVFKVEQTVTAFNGVPQGGKPVVLLHAYGTTPVTVTVVLVGTVSKFNKEGYGPRLDVTIPPLGGGQGAITDFTATIKKNFKFKGKQRSYVSSTCKDKTLKGRGQFIYKDGQSLTPTVKQRCSQKK